MQTDDGWPVQPAVAPDAVAGTIASRWPCEARGIVRGRRLPTLRAVPLTLGLVLAVIGLFEAVYIGGGDEAVAVLWGWAALTPEGVVRGEWWRVVTSALISTDWSHALTNAGWLLVFGLILEPAMGTGRLGFVSALAVVADAALSLGFEPRSGGASGILFSWFGLFLACPPALPERRPLVLRWLWLPVAVHTLWLLATDFDSPHTSLASHMSGLVAGFLAGSFAGRGARSRVARRSVWTRWAWVVPATAVVACVTWPNARWAVDWHMERARHREAAGDTAAARAHWDAVEALADTESCVGLEALAGAGRFHARVRDDRHAIAVLTDVVPKLEEPELLFLLGRLHRRAMPEGDSIAFALWIRALEIDPTFTLAHRSMADVLLNPRDSSCYWPEAARAIAWCALQADTAETGATRHALGIAYIHLDDPVRARYWMRAAIARGSERAPAYAEQLARYEAWLSAADLTPSASAAARPPRGRAPAAARPTSPGCSAPRACPIAPTRAAPARWPRSRTPSPRPAPRRCGPMP
jgi:membrane associated rhomboid family serine protease